LRTWGIVLALLAALGLFMWSVDYVTLEGEWTIYTVRCHGGNWANDRCTGELQPGERYRFRALKSKGEVVFWIVGSAEPSGKLAPCVIKDRSNWTCTANADAARSIALEMRKGRPVPPSLGEHPALHTVAKWRWFLLRVGIGS
jgi:hypothetical protein